MMYDKIFLLEIFYTICSSEDLGLMLCSPAILTAGWSELETRHVPVLSVHVTALWPAGTINFDNYTPARPVYDGGSCKNRSVYILSVGLL